MSKISSGTQFIPLAILIAILALGLSIWGAITYAPVAGRIFTDGPKVWNWGAAFLSTGFDFWFFIGAILWIAGTVIFILEISGRTIRGRRLVKQIIKWDSTDVSIAALCATIYGGGLVATAGLVIVPGFTWIRPANMLTPVFGILFGIPGAVGTAVGNFIADALGGFLGVGSIGGFVGNFLLAYVPYKFMRDNTLRSSRSVFEYYLWGVLVASIWTAIYISWWLHLAEPLIGLPLLFVWGWIAPFIFVNDALVTAIVGPFLVYVLYPVVKRWGLLWSERVQFT